MWGIGSARVSRVSRYRTYFRVTVMAFCRASIWLRAHMVEGLEKTRATFPMECITRTRLTRSEIMAARLYANQIYNSALMLLLVSRMNCVVSLALAGLLVTSRVTIQPTGVGAQR